MKAPASRIIINCTNKAPKVAAARSICHKPKKKEKKEPKQNFL